MAKPKISLLVAARKNSKYLAKFLMGFMQNTGNLDNVECLVMLNAHDTWNRELETFFANQSPRRVYFYEENLRLGRAGLHEYFNTLAKHARGDWLIYFCEDHFILAPNPVAWDQYFLARIAELQLQPHDVYVIVPKFDNAGAMNHMLSRGFYNAIGQVMGRHGWIDSYINDITARAFGRISPHVVRMDTETFHDFTHDKPTPMDDAHLQTIISERGKQLPKYGSDEYIVTIEGDSAMLKKATNREV